MAKTYSSMTVEELEEEIHSRREQMDKLRGECVELHGHLDERVKERVAVDRGASRVAAQVVGNPDTTQDED